MLNTNNIMHSLMAVRLAMLDLRLYMDTHGCSGDAMYLMQEYKEKYKKILEQYEAQNGAITWMHDDDCQWATTAFPWTDGRCDC